MRNQILVSVALATSFSAAILLLSSCSELKNNVPVASTATVKIHDDSWNNVNSSAYHGKYLKTIAWQESECKTCHGAAYTGGTSGQSCFDCHASYPHPAGFAPAGGHPTYLYTQNYPLSKCQSCHGVSYAGGSIVDVTCMRSGCHVDASNNPKSPEACNTCHGVFNGAAEDLLSAAPPRSLSGDSLTTARGVGAHQKHLLSGTVGKSVKCQECHVVPTQLSSPGHLGPSPAEVVFNDTLSQLKSAGGALVPHPVYDPSQLKCSNTFCHGDWRIRKATSQYQFVYSDTAIVGSNFSPVWTAGAASAACGSCHGIPPKGHIPLDISTCGTCHYGIVSADGKITNKLQHMNGKINVFGQEYSF